MRKLLIVVLLFSLSVIGLILLFNTVIQRSVQSNIEPVNDLPKFLHSEERLSQALRFPTTNDSLSTFHFKQFHSWIKKNYPDIFNNPNVIWQTFNEFSLVGKWMGRNSELSPIIIVASQETEEPDLETIHEWSFNPFMGKIDGGFIHGQGSRGSKSAMIAILESLQYFVKNNVLTDRTIYFAFPHNNHQGETEIINALKQATIKPEFILKTGGLICGENMLWDIKKRTGLIGIGQQSVTSATLECNSKQGMQIIGQEIQHLTQALPPIETDQPVLEQFLACIIPELGFSQRLVFSNQWLLSNLKQNRLQNNPVTQSLFGHNINAMSVSSDSGNSFLANLAYSAPTIKSNTEQWLKNHLQHPQVQILGESQTIQNNSKIASSKNHAYRIIENSCKEVFSDLITSPSLVNEPSSPDWYNDIDTDIYYFHPVIYNQKSFKKSLNKTDAKISIRNYKQMIQFYYKLLLNVI